MRRSRYFNNFVHYCKVQVDNCILDHDVATNVIPYSLYCVLHIGPRRPTDLTIQLANRSCTKSKGIVLYVMVRVGELIFLADFYVIRSKDEDTMEDAQALL